VSRQIAQRSNRIEIHNGPVLDRIGTYDVVDCQACGFAHAWPLPTPAELDKAYSEAYYAVEKPDYLVRAEADAIWANMFYADRLDALQHTMTQGSGPRRTLIDVGSGPGHFLIAARDAGWRVEGIEPSRQAAAFAMNKGLTIHNRLFNRAWAADQTSFDAVHCMNVLEHVADPVALVQAMHDVVRPGGAVCIGAPNDYNALQSAARHSGQKPWWVVPPHHLNYFSFETLEALLRRCGLKPVSRLTSFPMEAFLLMGRNYVGDDAAGRALHAERKVFDQNLQSMDPQIRRNFYQALSGAGFGREAIIIAVRP
jgi:SAM-dependent methyltransferase